MIYERNRESQELQGDPTAGTAPKTNSLVAAQFAFTRDPKRNATATGHASD
jgi:hypothetical protein